jgi:hypothetical protein
MESENERIERQGRFADYVLAQPEWRELLTEISDTIVREWMNGATVEAREMAYAKIKALGTTNGLVATWADRKKSQDIIADQEQGNSAP